MKVIKILLYLRHILNQMHRMNQWHFKPILSQYILNCHSQGLLIHKNRINNHTNILRNSRLIMKPHITRLNSLNHLREHLPFKRDLPRHQQVKYNPHIPNRTVIIKREVFIELRSLEVPQSVQSAKCPFIVKLGLQVIISQHDCCLVIDTLCDVNLAWSQVSEIYIVLFEVEKGLKELSDDLLDECEGVLVDVHQLDVFE